MLFLEYIHRDIHCAVCEGICTISLLEGQPVVQCINADCRNYNVKAKYVLNINRINLEKA